MKLQRHKSFDSSTQLSDPFNLDPNATFGGALSSSNPTPEQLLQECVCVAFILLRCCSDVVNAHARTDRRTATWSDSRSTTSRLRTTRTGPPSRTDLHQALSVGTTCSERTRSATSNRLRCSRSVTPVITRYPRLRGSSPCRSWTCFCPRTSARTFSMPFAILSRLRAAWTRLTGSPRRNDRPNSLRISRRRSKRKSGAECRQARRRKRRQVRRCTLGARRRARMAHRGRSP